MSPAEREKIFQDYFSIFPWRTLPAGARGADVGCGSGRWAAVVAPRVGSLLLADPSHRALAAARRQLAARENVQFALAGADSLPVPDGSLDFAYSLGVLHHVPDTAGALRAISRKLKPGAPFLLYLYYAFDGAPLSFRLLWRASDLVRRVVSRMPFAARRSVCDTIALLVYWPLSRGARLCEHTTGKVAPWWPLSYYRDKSWYVLRTDALDRFGTRLEKRFTKAEIAALLAGAGFTDVRFSDGPPRWTAVCRKGAS